MTTILRIGSSARGTNDKTSDIDILEIFYKKKENNTTKSKLHSTSSFSLDRAIHLSSKGSLFFKHAINEGIIISDTGGKWKIIKDSWMPARSYSHEIESNESFLNLLELIPKSNEGALAAIDIAATSARNILIRKLANSGIYEFSWESICKKSIDMHLIDESQAKSIMQGRALKNIRRQGSRIKISEKEATDLISEISSAIYSRKIKYRRVFELEKEIYQYKERSYGQLRALELLAAAHPNDPSFAKIIENSKNPSYFTSGKSKI